MQVSLRTHQTCGTVCKPQKRTRLNTDMQRPREISARQRSDQTTETPHQVRMEDHLTLSSNRDSLR